MDGLEVGRGQFRHPVRLNLAGNPGRGSRARSRRGIPPQSSSTQTQLPSLAPYQWTQVPSFFSVVPRPGRFLLPRLLPLPPGQAKAPHLPLSLPPLQAPRVPRVFSSSQEIHRPRCTHLGAGPRAPRWAPPPPAASAAAPRAPAFPYLTWTNACRQSQEFRPLTSASSSQGTARETEGRGWGRWEEGGGKAPTSSRSSLAEVSLFVCGFAPGPRASFPGISSFSERGRAGRCKVRSLRKQSGGPNPVT